jgi:hypothetical protein
MSISIHQTPNQFIVPIYNPMYITVTSTNSTQVNFKFIFEIVVNGITTKIKQPLNPDGYGVIDIHRTLENFLTKDFSNASLFQVNSNSFVKYTVKIGEEYGDPATEHLNITALTDYYAWNSIFDFKDFVTLNTSQYVLGDANKKFLTNSPRTIYIGASQESYLYFISNVANKVKKAIVQVHYTNSTTIEYEFTNANASPTTAQYLMRFSTGTTALAANGVNFTNAVFYTVNMVDNDIAINPTSESFTYYITDLCTKYTVYRIHFMNKLGGYDAFNFILKDTLTTDIKRTTFEKYPGTFNSQYGFSLSDSGTVNNNTEVLDKIKVESDFLLNADYVWLKEMLTSPDVYLETELTGTFMPINIIDTVYETQKVVQGKKLINLNITFTPSIQNSRQRF